MLAFQAWIALHEAARRTRAPLRAAVRFASGLGARLSLHKGKWAAYPRGASLPVLRALASAQRTSSCSSAAQECPQLRCARDPTSLAPCLGFCRTDFTVSPPGTRCGLCQESAQALCTPTQTYRCSWAGLALHNVTRQRRWMPLAQARIAYVPMHPNDLT